MPAALRATIFLAAAAAVSSLGASSNGLGEAYTWTEFSEAFGGSKPVMLVATKSYCGACKALKPQFAASPALLAASADFTMVSVGDEFAESAEKFQPDGGYIPRILFFHPDGTPIAGVTGPNPTYKHFFSDPAQIVAAMGQAKAAAAAAGASASVDDDDDGGGDDEAEL